MQVFFVYAGRQGSNLECAIALYTLATEAGFDSTLVLSKDNARAARVQKLYPQAEFYDFFSPADFLRLKKRLEAGITFFTIMSPKIVPLALSLGTPKIFYFHATYDYTYSKKTARDLFHELLHLVLIKSSNSVVATQPSLARQIKEKIGVGAGVLPHPPYSPIKPAFFSAKRQVRLPFKSGEYFLNFGEISRMSKGTGLLLDAAEGTKLPIVLAGRRKGVKPASNVFHLDRWVNDGELHYLVKNCKCVVLPYLLRSQFSGCLALAFHFGKPVLAPNTEAFEGWVEEGKTGWLFEHGDAADLREKMRQVAAGKLKFGKSAIEKKEKEMALLTRKRLVELLEGFEKK